MCKSPKGKLLRAVRRIAPLSSAAVMLCTAAPLAASADDAENRLSDPEWDSVCGRNTEKGEAARSNAAIRQRRLLLMAAVTIRQYLLERRSTAEKEQQVLDK